VTVRKPPCIGYIVDHPARDLNGALLLAHAAAKRGWRLVLIPMYDQAVDVPLLALDVLIVNYLRAATQELVRDYAESGVAVFVLDTEGGILATKGSNSLESLPKSVMETGCTELLAGYCFWGSRVRDVFADAKVLPAERLHLTGCPRFDVAAPRWSGLLQFHATEYVLFNANFPLVNSRFSKSYEDERQALIDTGSEPAYVDKMFSEQRGIFGRFIETLQAMAQSNPATAFLLRPHPFERVSTYEDAMKGYSNVKVDAEGSVFDVIHHARALVHVNCGTAVEATMLGRLPLSMEFINTPDMRERAVLPHQVSHRVSSLDALDAAIKSIPAMTADFPFAETYREFIAPWFYENDGFASERVLDAVAPAISGATRDPSVPRSLRASRRKLRYGQLLQALLANLFGSKASSALREAMTPRRGDKRLDIAAVHAFLARLAAHEGVPASNAVHARHPLTGLPLASIEISPPVRP
jgi:surface carbohydrate biosynthesis protein